MGSNYHPPKPTSPFMFFIAHVGTTPHLPLLGSHDPLTATPNCTKCGIHDCHIGI